MDPGTGARDRAHDVPRKRDAFVFAAHGHDRHYGRRFDADTQSNVTQYFFTVPSQYLDIALRAERSRADGFAVATELWAQERGAITQEVKQDDSNALYRLFVKMQTECSAVRRTRRTASGRSQSSPKTSTARSCCKFYQEWYHPNNAVYVIVGDVDPRDHRQGQGVFGELPAATLPPRAPVAAAARPALYHEPPTSRTPPSCSVTVCPVTIAPIMRRAKYSATCSSQRSDFGGLPYTGKALGTQFFRRAIPNRHRHRVRRRPGDDAARDDRRELRAIITGTAKAEFRPIWSRPQSFARSPSSSSAATRSKGKPTSGARRLQCKDCLRPTT